MPARPRSRSWATTAAGAARGRCAGGRHHHALHGRRRTGAPAPMCWPASTSRWMSQAKRMPSRAMGVAWFGIDRAARTLGRDPDDARDDEAAPAASRSGEARQSRAPARRPSSRLRRSMSASSTSRATIRRRPRTSTSTRSGSAAELRDIYGVLIDGMQGERGRLRSGGDGGAAFNAPPPTQKPLAFIPASSRWRPTARRRSTSRSPPSTARSASWRSPGARPRSAMPSKDVIVRDPRRRLRHAAALPRAWATASRLRFDIVNAEGAGGRLHARRLDRRPAVDERAPTRIQQA